MTTSTKTLLSVLLSSILLAGCGGGEAPAPEGGGGAPGEPSSSSSNGGGSSGGGAAKKASGNPAQQASRASSCIQKAGARASTEGEANLNPAAKGAAATLIVTFKNGNRANVFFFPNEDLSQDANSNARNGKLSFRDGSIATAFAKEPSDDDRDVVKDCLPKSETEDKDKGN